MSGLPQEEKSYGTFREKLYSKPNTAYSVARDIARRLVDELKGELLHKRAIIALLQYDIFQQLSSFRHIVPHAIYQMNKYGYISTDKITHDSHIVSENARWQDKVLFHIGNGILCKIKDPVFAYIENNIEEEMMSSFGEAIKNFLWGSVAEKNKAFLENPYYWSDVADKLGMDVSRVSAIKEKAYENLRH